VRRRFGSVAKETQILNLRAVFKTPLFFACCYTS